MPDPRPSDKTRYDKKLTEILGAAAEVFSEHGYDRASIRMVADRAAVSVAGIYHYVRSKEELLFLIQHRVFDDLVERFKADSQSEPDPAARLRILIHNHLERFLANMAELIVCSREIDRLRGDFLRQVEARQHEYFALALGLFQEVAESHGGAGVAPRTAALAMFGSINWVYTWYHPGSGAPATRLAEDFTQLFLRGVLPPSEPEPVPEPEPAPALSPDPTGPTPPLPTQPGGEGGPEEVRREAMDTSGASFSLPSEPSGEAEPGRET